ncbi:MAG: permease [Patescibacteria group bacterium]|nr:permease [Patescibacteria group bacterium]
MNKNLAFKQTCNNFKKSLPFLLGIILLIAFLMSVISPSFLHTIFTGKALVDSFIGSVFGSILAGNPVNSYIISSELLEQGVSMIAVVAFIISWVTVGIVQFPAEASLLGKKFAIVRNVVSFFMAIVIAIITVLILQLL